MFWLVIALVFFVLWLSERSERKSDASNARNEGYRYGYWDGYRALKDKIKQTLGNSRSMDASTLEQLMTDDEQEQELGDIVPTDAAVQWDDDTSEIVVEQPARIDAVQEAPEDKQQRTLRNLNTVLYMGSFLLVAAAAALIAAAVPALVRLGILIVVTILFYVAGIILYRRMAHLRPAAIAFVGTGLAILPFIGVAMTLIGDVPSDISWFITSIVGLIAYIVATVVLQSQLVSYLTLAFVLSLTSSAVTVASLPLVWHFVALIAVSLVASSISVLKPNLVPKVFREPVEFTGQAVTPLALLASFFVADRLELFGMQVIFGVATAHYLVAWLQEKIYLYEGVSRALLHVTLSLLAWDIADGDLKVFGLIWLALCLAQAAYSIVRAVRSTTEGIIRENNWLLGVVGGLLFGMSLWVGSADQALLTTGSLVSVLTVSAAAMYFLRDVRWGYGILAVSVPLLLTLGRWLADPVWSWQVFVVIFGALSAGVLLATKPVRIYDRSRTEQALYDVALAVYMTGLVVSGFLTGDALIAGWAVAAAIALLVTYSYIVANKDIELVAAVASPVVFGLWLDAAQIESKWYWFAVVTVSTAAMAVATLIHQFRGEVDRRNATLTAGLVFVAGLALGGVVGATAVAATSVALLIAAALVCLGLRRISKSDQLIQAFRASYAAYIVLAWLVSLTLPDTGWQPLVYIVATIIFWLASYIEKSLPLVVAGNIALVVAVTSMWHWLDFSREWREFGIVWISAAILYGMYWLMVERNDKWRSYACIGSIWTLVAVLTIISLGSNLTFAQHLAASITLILGAATAIVHGVVVREKNLMEIGIYVATFGAQQLIELAIPETNLVVYAHWWALTLALVAWWRSGDDNLWRLMVAAGLVTASTGYYALVMGGWYQLFFLIEHLVLLAVGALTARRWAMWWGVVASSAAVLYFLKDYLYLWLGFLGLVLIAIVVWRLSAMAKSGGSR